MVLPEPVGAAIARLEACGYEAVAVGGCVRDHLMFREPTDYDLATSALPEEVMDAFRNARLVPTGLKHGTLTLISGGMAIEITTYRVDGAYRDHRRPDGVRFTGSLIEDLKRRDFTVNAIAYSPVRGLIDPMGGGADIENRLIRAVGDPSARFGEDALRILRALRFAARLGFSIEPATAAALTAMAPSLSFVARERVGAEVEGIALGRGAGPVLAAHREVLEAAVPEISFVDAAGYARALSWIDRAPAEAAARLAALFSPLRGGAAAALESLRLPGRITCRALRLIDWLNAPDLDPARALGALGANDARALFQMLGGPGAAALEGLIASSACVTIGQLAVDGRDLVQMGLSGPAVGAALQKLLDAVIAGAPNDRAALLSRIRTLL